MIRLIKFLLTGDWHLHHWIKENEGDLYSGSSLEKRLPTGFWEKQRCNKCGKVRMINLS